MGLLRFRNLYAVDTTQRIEAFSDGVFAIAITLLVLEIKVPHGTELAPSLSLKDTLLHLWPSYFAYLFSFLIIGIYWTNHHFIFHLYKRSDHIFALLNVFFLMCISFLPFPTAVLAQYMRDPDNCQTAVLFYAFGLFLPAFSWLLTWLYARSGYRLIERTLTPAFVRRLTLQYTLSCLLYLMAIAMTLWNPRAGLTICVGFTLLYLLPPKKPVYSKSA